MTKGAFGESGDMNQVPAGPSTATLEREVPHLRLNSDADLNTIYQLGRKLGQGCFGLVYEATHLETQTKWAIKEVCKPVAGSSKVEMVDNEINILKQINHAHVIRLEAVYSSTTSIYLVSELCEGGDLKQLLAKKKFCTEDETRKIISSLADAVAYLHKKDIIHRDLKLENILLKKPYDNDESSIDIKVVDFGLSVKAGGVGIDNIMTDTCGTLIYMAPEMMSGRGYSHWCDVWSIGVIMFMLLCGEPPFMSRTKKELLKTIMSTDVEFTQPIWSQVSDAAKYLLTYLLKAEPSDRMSVHQLLENPWVKGDTTFAGGPTNVLEMMFHYLDNEEKAETPEVSSTSADNLEPSVTPQVSSADPKKSGVGHAKPLPESSSAPCTSSTFLKVPHAGEKSPRLLSRKLPQPREKRDPSTGKKTTSGLEDQKSSSSRKVRPASTNQQLSIPV